MKLSAQEKEEAIRSFLMTLVIVMGLGIMIFVKPETSHAMMINAPYDARTVSVVRTTNGTYDMLATSTTRTILSVEILGTSTGLANGSGIVQCDGVAIASAASASIGQNYSMNADMQYYCDGAPVRVVTTNTGTAGNTYLVTYIDARLQANPYATSTFMVSSPMTDLFHVVMIFIVVMICFAWGIMLLFKK